MASLKDIAQSCGVSVATVSKALNNHSDISQARREQIKAKAKELGYFPNQAARALKTRSTMDIGVLFADEHNSGLTHPFFSQVLEGLKLRAEEKGYDLTFIGIKSNPSNMSFLEHCIYRNVDGVVIACVDFDQPDVQELTRSRLPVVTIDHVIDDCATICSNNMQGMYDLTKYVISKGHRKISFVHGTPCSATNARMVGFFRALEDNGIDIPDVYVRETPFLDDEQAYNITCELLALGDRPTCIMYPDDYCCIGGMNAIRDMGLSVPGDVSITGYDGVPLGKVLSPKITTYEQNMLEMGKVAADKAIELIERPRTGIKNITVIDGQLYEGESVGTIK
ncbi:MAG: LacI family DNA-binding transcriptional regulator [Lachnospiraceae bacterium]|nr:LacI family DNA-binding transcriptional regulator [Lachnospiraceae bacterium]